MKKFNRYKVNASELPDLMTKEQGNTPPTQKETEEFFKIIQKDMVDITERQKGIIMDVISKTANYDYNSFSGTMKKLMYKHYAYSQYKISKVSVSSEKPMQLDKGEISEPAAIKLLSLADGVEYKKNDKLFSNQFFKGVPDIVVYENEKIVGVKDIKAPLDFIEYLERVDGDLLKDDAWEMRAYLDILDLRSGEICYCLVNMPDELKDKRLSEHTDRLTLKGYTVDHVKKIVKQIERSMGYDYIPDNLKIRRFTVERKSWFTKQAHASVKLLRQKMNRLHDKFTNTVTLVEIPEQ